MAYKVRDWMVDVVVYVDPSQTVYDALSLMRRRYTHSVIVDKSKTNPEFGIITSTDISDKIVALSQNPSMLKCSEIMTSPLIVVPDTLPLEECAVLMHKHHIHHLPVENEHHELIGMISATDFMVAAEAMGR